MGKPIICICVIKGTDQLRGNREADQCLCFLYMDRVLPLLAKIQNFTPLAILCGCTALFVSDLVGNPDCWFCHKAAQMSIKSKAQISFAVTTKLISAFVFAIRKEYSLFLRWKAILC